MPQGRLFIGRLSHRTEREDIEDFFRGYGKLIEIVIKRGYAFVEFEEKRDAEDALERLNGKTLCGERVNIEFSRHDRGYGRDNERSYSRSYNNFRYNGSRYGNRSTAPPPYYGRYRMLVQNLTTAYTWSDLKRLMSDCNPAFTDAHKKENRLGIVCFNNLSDLKHAMKKYQGKEINGRKIKLIDDSSRSRSRSRSRSHSPARRRHSSSDSRSRSPPGRHREHSGSPVHKRARSESRSKSPVPSKSAKGRSRSSSSSNHSAKKRPVDSPSCSYSPSSPVRLAEVNGKRSGSVTPDSRVSQ